MNDEIKLPRTNELLKVYPPESHSWAGKLTFNFSDPHAGWIMFSVTCTVHEQSLSIDLSHVNDPFPEFIPWLATIAEGHLPSEFSIDEEGYGKTLRATAVNEDEFLFEIVPWLWNKEKRGEEPLFMYVIVSKKQFLSEFMKRWDEFLANQYDREQWQAATDLSKLDLSTVRAVVNG